MINSKNKENNRQEGYSFQLRYEKIKLHLKYILVICLGITVCSVALSCYNQDVFIQQLSLAGTITSIVLSVIAIIMSISGESKTEGIRNQMIEITNELRNNIDIVTSINDGVSESMQELQKNINLLEDRIKSIPEETAKQFYQENTFVSKTEGYKKISSEEDWNNGSE